MNIYENDDIVVILWWIGKIQATMATMYCCEHYTFEKLINIGIAGSLLGNEASIGDVFLLTKIVQHDIYLPFEWTHLNYAKQPIIISHGISNLMIDQCTIHYEACCCTGDQFIADEKTLSYLRSTYQWDVVEMEAFAIASVVHHYDLIDRCIFIKAISDGASASAITDHMDNLDVAMHNSMLILNAIITSLS